MANATTELLVVGLLVVLPVGAGQPKSGHAAQQAVPDVLVYVENSVLVPPLVLARAEATAARMFAGIGLQVQWADRRLVRGAETSVTLCAPKRAEEIVVRMASGRTRSASSEALAAALPYARTGVRVSVFYGEFHEATRMQPRMETAVLAHVLVHEIAHVLQGMERHSSTGVMRAHWTAGDYADMERRPLEFNGDDAELIHLGLQRRHSTACAETASAFGVRE